MKRSNLKLDNLSRILKELVRSECEKCVPEKVGMSYKQLTITDEGEILELAGERRWNRGRK